VPAGVRREGTALSLITELTRRGVHEQVLVYCDEELIRQSLFHAVFEAVKGLGARLRMMTGSSLDGSALIDCCFGTRSGQPIVRINPYASETDQSEHKGFANLIRGIFGTFRNPPAHATRAAAEWIITEADALDLFCTLSLIHRRLDNAAVRVRQTVPPTVLHNTPKRLLNLKWDPVDPYEPTGEPYRVMPPRQRRSEHPSAQSRYRPPQGMCDS
jgi:uncharacterized protein (TIGR02391 family)